MPAPNVSGSTRTTRSNSSPFDSSGVSDRTRDVAWNVGIADRRRRSRRRARRARCRGSSPGPSRSVYDGDAGAADGGRHVGVRERGPDDRLGFGHDLLRRPVVDAQRGQVDPVEPDPLEPLLPRLGEAVPGLGAVPDDGEAPGRAAEQQHLPLGVGQLLRLVHDDVRERAGEQVRVGAGQCGLVDQAVLQVLPAQHRHHQHLGVVGRDQVVDDPVHLLAFGRDGGLLPTPAS